METLKSWVGGLQRLGGCEQMTQHRTALVERPHSVRSQRLSTLSFATTTPSGFGTFDRADPSRLTIPSARGIGPGSEGQVEPECFIELGTQWAVEGADQRSDALDVDRSNLLGLSLRVALEPG